MRLVVFGALGPDGPLLVDRRVRSLLMTLLTAPEQAPEQAPESAVAAGLFTRTPTGPALGHRVLAEPPLAAAAVAAAGSTAADVIGGRLPSVRRHLPAGPAGDWDAVGLLVVGGVLLDILVGNQLRDQGLVGPATGSWRLWALQDPPAVTVGMRCDHDAALALGAGVMWVDRGDLTEPLPRLADLATVLDGHAGAARAESGLRLRHTGWVSGREHRFLLLERGPLYDELDAIASRIVDSAYRPLVDDAADDHSRLMTSRLIMERCLAELVSNGTMGGTAPQLRRLAWRGPNWRLFEESAIALTSTVPDRVPG